MRRLATASTILSFSLLVPVTAFASDIVWEVQSPFRFFKKQTSFAVQEKAFEAVRGKADAPLPANIVWRTERRLNDPDCTDKSSPGRSAWQTRSTSDPSTSSSAMPTRCGRVWRSSWMSRHTMTTSVECGTVKWSRCSGRRRCR